MELPKYYLAIALISSSVFVADAVKSGRNNDVASRFDMAGLVAIVGAAPKNKFNIIYETATAELGNTICPYRTVYPARVEYDAYPGKNYTILFLDVDLPSQAAPALRSYVLQMRINVPGRDISMGGFEIAPRIPPTPTPGSGPHRYVSLLYEQSKYIEPMDKVLVDISIRRYRFNVTCFARDYKLGEPIAGNYFIEEISKEYERECNRPRYSSPEL